MSPEEVAETVRLTIAAGAVGINLENTIQGSERALYELPDAVRRICAAREAAAAAAVPS